MAFARMTGVRWARGWRIDTIKWAAQAQSMHLRFANEVDRMLNIVRKMGFDTTKVDFALPCSRQSRERIDELLLAHRLPPGRLVAIAPGAKRATNLWIPDRFAEVGRELSGQGYDIVLLGGKSETRVCDEIAAAVSPLARSFAGALSVAESCEMLRRCSLVVCVDSGVQHLASAVGTPTVSLFSFWQMYGKWRPYGEANQVIQKWVPCHTCLLDECPRGNLCMTEISVVEVIKAARHALSESRTAASSSPTTGNRAEGQSA
jgi:ADP-heptose:LPS heptosyltransferase